MTLPFSKGAMAIAAPGQLNLNEYLHREVLIASKCWSRLARELMDGNKYKDGIYMVFEYKDHDLIDLADRPGMRFTAPKQAFDGASLLPCESSTSS
ncbi:cyclin-dependent kinase C-2-like isoform X2 [Prosopis cineraria]|uniref:cyclin-dependent kinase C-2-like isoform X2 n=1 Tax=Prosopis cineraria TaxID=364024 RepID=UPI00241069A8|nr:cyclin-dependent kinase C-2-like isoform X2 [Prosopis cineraria]